MGNGMEKDMTMVTGVRLNLIGLFTPVLSLWVYLSHCLSCLSLSLCCCCTSSTVTNAHITLIYIH